MSDSTQLVLRKAIEWADSYHTPLILASTTGDTAQKSMQIANGKSVRLIVITHDPKRTYSKIKFNSQVRSRLQNLGHLFLEDRSPWLPRISISRLFETVFRFSSLSKRDRKWTQSYGIGGKVCFMIAEKAFKAGFIKENEVVVCVAGRRSGIDTALVLEVVQPINLPLSIELIQILHMTSETPISDQSFSSSN